MRTDPRPARARGEAEHRPAHPRTDDGGLAEAMRALALGLDKKAVEPILLDVRELCTYCNYQLLLSGRSERQVEAIADAISTGMKAEGFRPLGTEGARGASWQLLDFGDVVVHVFHHPARDHYDLEGLWIDAPRVPLEVPADARLSAEERYS
jgi:ribosome-associated protein